MADVDLVSTTVDEHVNAFRTGLVDAIVTFEPVRSQLLESGARSLFDSATIPGRIVDVLAVRGEAAELNSDTLRRLVRGYFTAIEYQKNHRRDASRRASARMRLPEEKVTQIYNGLNQLSLDENQRLLRAPAKEFQSTTRRLVELMSARQMLHRMPAIGNLADGRWLPDSL